MADPLAALKQISCPAGDGCTNDGCLFRHRREQLIPASPANPAAGQIQTSAGQREQNKPDAQDGARKRQKLSATGLAKTVNTPIGNTARNTPSSSASASSTKQGTNTIEHRSSSDPATRLSKVSPPPLKRKQPAPSTLASASSNSPKLNPVLNPTKPSSSLAVKQAAKPTAPAKLETLQPRPLNSQPAVWAVRRQLILLYHEELTRLNCELKKDANDEEQKLLLSDQQLISMALDEEQNIALTRPAVYKTAFGNKVVALRKMGVKQWKEERAREHQKKLEAERPVKQSALGAPREIRTGLTPKQEVNFLSRLLTPVTKLAQYGYVPTVPTEADIQNAKQAEEASKGWEVCDRCQTRFQLFPGRREEDGALTSGGKCLHHHGKSYFPPRQPGQVGTSKKIYKCCGETVGGSAGCHTTDNHVFKTSDPKRLAAVLNFAETPENPAAPKDRAVAFDCEMGYTVKGMELLRLTATSWPAGDLLLDVLVRPYGEILDLNSRYSGVWPEDLVKAKPFSGDFGQFKQDRAGAARALQVVSSPAAARALFFSLVAPSTPVLGHGLENDLNALRVVHPTLVDTILLYPHGRGLPIRNGLKVLMRNLLNREIQSDTPEEGDRVTGHDSAEDARAAGELVRLKIEERWKVLKLEGWTLEGDELVPPGGRDNEKAQLTVEDLERERGP